MNFKIEQIAIILPAGANRLIGEKILEGIGAQNWHRDTVVAEGRVFGAPTQNVARLAFNYEIGEKLEFEVLDYSEGKNWRDNLPGVSHFGMHVTESELRKWRAFFELCGIQVAQEVVTKVHTNPAIKDSRRYNYVIFDTRPFIGVDLKFIVRLNLDGTPFAGE